jgi:hypothetical protein
MTVGGELYLRPTLVHHIKEKESGYWLTPNCMDSLPTRSPEALKKQYDNNRQNRSTHSTLREQVVYPPPSQMWPTPATRDYKGANGFKATQEKISQGRRSHMGQLPNAVMMEKNEAIGGTLNPTWVEKLMGWPDDWTMLQPISHVKICFWVMGFYDGKETRTREVLRVLRIGHAAQEIQREIGRPVSIYETSILLAELCEYANRPDEARIFMACSKALKAEMRDVWLCEGTAGTSYQSRQDAQQSGEYSNVMQALSRFLAYHGQTHWKEGSWENAMPRVADGVAARVDRLKAIGNGQVPAVAATAWRLLK